MLVDPTDGNIKMQVQSRGYEKKWGRRIIVDSLVYNESIILPCLLFVFIAHDNLPGVCEGQLVDGVKEEEQPVEPLAPPTPPSMKPSRGMRITAAFHRTRRNEGQR